MKILVVSSAVPFPPIGGGRLRTYHLLSALATVHDTTLVAFTYEGDEPVESNPMPLPVRVITVPWDWPLPYQEMSSADKATSDRAADCLANPDGQPWFASFYESPQMERELRRLFSEGFDLVLFEGTDMARFLPAVPREVRKVLDLMDVHSRMALRALDGTMGSECEQLEKEFQRTLRFERDASQACDACLVCSELEASAAAELLQVERLHVVANGVDTSCFSAQPLAAGERLEIVFTGTMDYPPNVEGVQYFVREMLPEISSARPDARFHVVGAKPVPQIKSLARENVIVHGRVDDIRPYLSMATVVVVPLLSGGGTRLKILEAAASARPIVTTSLGVEGLAFSSPQDLFIADSPSTFSQYVLRLAADPSLRAAMGERARAASLPYDWYNVGASLLNALDSLMFQSSSACPPTA